MLAATMPARWPKCWATIKPGDGLDLAGESHETVEVISGSQFHFQARSIAREPRSHGGRIDRGTAWLSTIVTIQRKLFWNRSL
jgi:hypothetical protein